MPRRIIEVVMDTCKGNVKWTSGRINRDAKMVMDDRHGGIDSNNNAKNGAWTAI